jgi:hypothetical protein
MVQDCSLLWHLTYIAHTPTENHKTQRMGGKGEEERALSRKESQKYK